MDAMPKAAARTVTAAMLALLVWASLGSSAPPGDASFDACQDKQGRLRAVPAAVGCLPQETPTSWPAHRQVQEHQLIVSPLDWVPRSTTVADQRVGDLYALSSSFVIAGQQQANMQARIPFPHDAVHFIDVTLHLLDHSDKSFIGAYVYDHTAASYTSPVGYGQSSYEGKSFATTTVHIPVDLPIDPETHTYALDAFWRIPENPFDMALYDVAVRYKA